MRPIEHHTNHPKEYGHLTYRRRNIEGSTTTSYRCVEYTKIHLHTKFERNLLSNDAIRPQTTVPQRHLSKYDL